jgi:hypothetical protein
MSAAPIAAGICQLGQHALLLCSHPHQALLLDKQPAGTTAALSAVVVCTGNAEQLKPCISAVTATICTHVMHPAPRSPVQLLLLLLQLLLQLLLHAPPLL